ncbi:MAG: class I SAM-dependent methyltransferase [Blastocatellia bacterium]|nr:class I SAM-dependent methyltransferase [Blastocatellia bacterium]
MPLEREELGPVQGKSLLHLQCHFGLDTLSWARLGAQVTGADFSDQAIETATQLSRECDIPARFVCSNLYELPQNLSGQFDIVFTSYGVLCWLPDLKEWARVIAHFLKPGGIFYIADSHPFGLVFDDSKTVTGLQVGYPYFSPGKPLELIQEATYTDASVPIRNTTECIWVYTIGDVINALLEAGLHIEFLHEFPFYVCQLFPAMQKSADGWWRFPDETSLPLLFSIKARQPD